MRDQFAVWRAPLLLSLALHAAIFWPKPLQDSNPRGSVGAVAAVVQAHLRPARVAEPVGPVLHETPLRHATVTHASPSPRRSRPAAAQASGGDVNMAPPAMQATVGLDAGAVRAFRLTLSHLMAASALRQRLGAGMQGRVEVGIAISASGQVRDVAVLQGSGSAALDNAVLAALRGVAAHAPIPAAMQGREFVLAVPVEIGTLEATSEAGR